MKTFNLFTRKEKDIFHYKSVTHLNLETVNQMTMSLIHKINDCETLENISKVLEDAFDKITSVSNKYFNLSKHETDNKENTH